MEAVTRAMAMGLGPAAHVYERDDGQVVYMPGATHEDYVRAMAELGATLVDSDDAPIEGSDLATAIGAIIDAIRKQEETRFEGKILKADSSERMVWGWASVNTVNGELITDKQGDQIPPQVMEKAATRFMQSVRAAKAMHEGGSIGEVVHSLPLTKQIAESLGISSPIEGWIIAMKVHDEAVWKRVQSGELKAFSIGGSGQRHAI